MTDGKDLTPTSAPARPPVRNGPSLSPPAAPKAPPLPAGPEQAGLASPTALADGMRFTALGLAGLLTLASLGARALNVAVFIHRMATQMGGQAFSALGEMDVGGQIAVAQLFWTLLIGVPLLVGAVKLLRGRLASGRGWMLGWSLAMLLTWLPLTITAYVFEYRALAELNHQDISPGALLPLVRDAALLLLAALAASLLIAAGSRVRRWKQCPPDARARIRRTVLAPATGWAGLLLAAWTAMGWMHTGLIWAVASSGQPLDMLVSMTIVFPQTVLFGLGGALLLRRKRAGWGLLLAGAVLKGLITLANAGCFLFNIQGSAKLDAEDLAWTMGQMASSLAFPLTLTVWLALPGVRASVRRWTGRPARTH